MAGKRKQVSEKSLVVESESKRQNLDLAEAELENKTETDENSTQATTSKEASDTTQKTKRKYERKITRVYKCSDCDFETDTVSLFVI